MKQARAWLEAEPHRLPSFRRCLSRGDLEGLNSSLAQMGPSPFLDRLRRGNLAEWRPVLEAIADLPPPGKGFSDGKQPELHYRAIRVGDGLYRSCQPRAEHLLELKEQVGLVRVVNLRQECEASKALCQELGLEYHYMSVVDHGVPELEQVERFLALLDHEPTLVHCHAGRGRTGIFVACFRIRAGLTAAEALAKTEGEVQPIRPTQRAWVESFASG